MTAPHWSKTIGNPFAVRVTPKASANRITAEIQQDGSMLVKIYVTTVPEDGKANRAVLKLLAKELGVAKSSLTIIRGATERNKWVQIDRSS
uniref:DUF167 domain-containing protein n=1 Tax=Pararhizobium sp. IMCC3301 TaxID=3067904 RepID=UPI0027404D2D|nr:DUF167 domain-containing protein [Pararhizobium sp. IMCC3301]